MTRPLRYLSRVNPLSYPNVGTDLDRTTRLLKHHYLKAFRRAGVDLSTEQWVLLDHLYQEGPASQTDLANGTYKDAPTVSRIIDKLVKKGLVNRERFPNDRRRHNVVITDSGRDLHDNLQPHVQSLREQTWRGLSEEDHARLQYVLEQIRNNFGG